MSLQGRRSSLLNIDNWLDKCTSDEPDSMIYDPDYCNEIATVRTKHKLPEIESLYRSVTDICTKIGLPPEVVDERVGDIDECISTFINTIEKDVHEEFERLCQYKHDLLEQIQKINSDLYLPPYVSDENITLIQHCKRLKTKFNELNVVKQKRMTRLQELRDQQTMHCLVLGIKTPQVKMQTDIPTEEELNKLASAVSDLKEEESRRRAKYTLLKDMISKCMEQTEYVARNEFEKNVSTSEPSFTESHMLMMSEFHSRLEAEYAKHQEKYDKLKTRLESLFDRLDVDMHERIKFFEFHSSCKPSVLQMMELEVEQYEELKRKNVGKFIEKIKDELLVEYERCYIPAEDQETLFSLKDASEELLELFERELDRIKNYYEENKAMLEKFQKWRDMWKELIELEVKANDPNRFNNRGGQLLIEEKKRKTLQKRLPKVEEELMELNEKFSVSKGNKFKVFGTPLDEFIAGCWDELNNAKEEEKRERQRAKMTGGASNQVKKGVQPQMVPKKTPTKRPAGPPRATPTPSKFSCQRSILGTPSGSTQKLNKLVTTGSVKKSVQKLTLAAPRNYIPKSGQLSGNRSNIPVPQNSNVNHRDKTVNSNGSDFSALSLSEQEFEDMIVGCAASAKRYR